jgi:hypothetical protein
MQSEQTSKVALLVISCDKYKDLWDPFFLTFFKFWNDCPFKVYLASNFSKHINERVTTITYGEDQDYSSNLIKVLNEVKEEWVIVWFEDAFIIKKVNNDLVVDLVNEVINNHRGVLKLTVDYPLYYGSRNEKFGPIPRGVKYRSAFGMALYQKSTLFQILTPGQSAWALDKSNAVDEKDIEFYALNSKFRFNRPISIINSVIKGKWYKDAPPFLKKIGLKEYISNRAVQSITDYLYIKFFLLRLEIYFLFRKYWYN